MAPSTGQKRPYKSPTDEDERNEDALGAELARKTRALSLSQAGVAATVVPRVGPNFRKLKIQEFDRTASLLGPADSDADVKTDVDKVCALIDGDIGDGGLERIIDHSSTGSIRKSLRLAYQEINCILCDSIDALVEEVIELGIGIDMTVFDQCRNQTFIEEQEANYMSSLDDIQKLEAITLLRESRCEIAWMKDNRNRLVDYVEEAKSIRDVGASHEFRFDFYPRNRGIELLENENKEKVLYGENETVTTSTTPNQHGAMSPAKRKRLVSISTDD